MDLTDFCPFRSPGEAPGSLFSLPCTSLEHPAILRCRCPGNHRPSILPGSAPPKSPPRARARGDWGGLSIAAGSLYSAPKKEGDPVVGVGSQRSLRAGSLEMGHSGSSLGNREEEGKERAGVMSWRRPRRDQSPALLSVGFWPRRSPHAGTAAEPFPGELGTSNVRVPPPPHWPPALAPVPARAPVPWHRHGSPPAGCPRS